MEQHLHFVKKMAGFVFFLTKITFYIPIKGFLRGWVECDQTIINVHFNDIECYYIPITDTTLEMSVFWPSDTESRINELRFSESISLSFKTRLAPVTCFCGDVT